MTAVHDLFIEQVAQTVFSTMLDLDLNRFEVAETAHSPWLLATIQIAGGWTGSAVLAMSPEVAKYAAAHMLRVDLNEVTTADEHDAAAELVNMVGGNLKSLLPGPSFLSLPTIVAGREFEQQIHDAEQLDDVYFISSHGLLRVSLFGRREK